MRTAKPPRVVFDCNVYVQALVNAKGPAAACWQRTSQGEAILIVSHEVFSEVRDVLNRPSLRKQFPSLNRQRVDAFLNEVEKRAVLVEDIPIEFVYERDPKDSRYINLALAARAQLIVSRDKDLLDLTQRESAESTEFRKRFPDLTILDPVAFLGTLDRLAEAE